MCERIDERHLQLIPLIDVLAEIRELGFAVRSVTRYNSGLWSASAQALPLGRYIIAKNVTPGTALQSLLRLIKEDLGIVRGDEAQKELFDAITDQP